MRDFYLRTVFGELQLLVKIEVVLYMNFKKNILILLYEYIHAQKGRRSLMQLITNLITIYTKSAQIKYSTKKNNVKMNSFKNTNFLCSSNSCVWSQALNLIIKQYRFRRKYSPTFFLILGCNIIRSKTCVLHSVISPLNVHRFF